MYRPGLPQALSQATQRPSTLLSAPGCIRQNSLLPLASSIETSCDDDTACLFLWKNIFTRTFVCVRAKLTIVLVFLFFFYEPESLLWFESEKGDGDKQRWTNKWLVLIQSCKKFCGLHSIRIKKILHIFTHQNSIGFEIIALNNYFWLLKWLQNTESLVWFERERWGCKVKISILVETEEFTLTVQIYQCEFLEL